MTLVAKKIDSFLTRDLAYGHVQVRMAEWYKALRSGRSLFLFFYFIFSINHTKEETKKMKTEQNISPKSHKIDIKFLANPGLA